MAKAFKPKTSGITIDDEENVTEVTEAVQEETTPVSESEPEVTFNETLEQKSAVKNVKILPKENHNCSIGGVRYYLRKGVQQSVPEEVKAVLLKSGLLMPL